MSRAVTQMHDVWAADKLQPVKQSADQQQLTVSMKSPQLSALTSSAPGSASSSLPRLFGATQLEGESQNEALDPTHAGCTFSFSFLAAGFARTTHVLFLDDV